MIRGRSGYSVQECIDEFQQLASDRMFWEKYWRDIATYVLPHAEEFDDIVLSGSLSSVDLVTSTPAPAKKSVELYDMTSLWAIERLTAGLLSLKTPETEYWHGMKLDSLFGEEETHQEKIALERLRNYLFAVRANPKSGFWPAHRSAVKSMCAFGDGWMFIEEKLGTGPGRPYRYEFMALSQLYPGMSPEGQPNRMFRQFGRTSEQIVRKFGRENVHPTLVAEANDPAKRHTRHPVLHCVKPRDDVDRDRIGVYGAQYSSCYILPEEKFEIGESGYFEFPFVRYAWSNTGTKPFSYGPVAYALGEIKSMQEMAKNELLASAASLRPAMAIAGKNMTRLNFNPGVSNPGLISPDGKQLFAPLNSGARPDFSQAVMEQRRGQLREMLYLNLWQILMQDGEKTATESMIIAQEKGEMFGPVGISLNEGLSAMTDREVGILSRKKAFADGSPLAMPDSMDNKNVSPTFSSPLDRLRRMGEMIGMQRVVEFAILIAGGDPQQGAKIMARFDIDEMLDKAQEILGAPATIYVSKEVAGEARGQQDQMAQAMQALIALKGSGEAATALGEGAQQVAAGAEMVGNSPKTQQLGRAVPAMQNAATDAAARQAA